MGAADAGVGAGAGAGAGTEAGAGGGGACSAIVGSSFLDEPLALGATGGALAGVILREEVVEVVRERGAEDETIDETLE